MTTLKEVLLLALLSPWALTTATNGTCPDHWIHDQSLCVWISDYSTVYWNATDHCLTEHSHLAYINSPDENSFLSGLLYDRGWDSVWIGLNDQEVRNVFEWQSDDQLVYANFHCGEPFNLRGHATKNCVTLNVHRNRTWTPEYCFEAKGFICRKRV